MGKVINPDLIKLFCGVIFNHDIDLDRIRKLLTDQFGEIDLELGPLPFDYTDYYEEEMGGNLSKSFFSFKELREVSETPEIKLWTNDLEDQFNDTDGNRRINLDPGYIELAKLVLSTTKNFSHRIYIGKGIYAEITLIFRNGKWEALEWTYPDFKSKQYVDFFLNIRNIYRKQLKQGN